VVVLTVLDVVAAHDLDLAEVRILLPLCASPISARVGQIEHNRRTLRKSTFLRSFCSWCLNWRTIALREEDKDVFVDRRRCRDPGPPCLALPNDLRPRCEPRLVSSASACVLLDPHIRSLNSI
jgi:hypothetical protein